MARKEHGYALTQLVLKPDTSRFTMTREGFDVGSRTFCADEDSIQALIPELDRADTEIQWREPSTGNTRSGTYSRMYVASVSDITEGKNGIHEFTVSYLGLIKDQKRVRQTTQTAITTFNGALADDLELTKRLYESAPAVTRVYVTSTKPDYQQLGQSIIPPGWEEYRLVMEVDGIVVPALSSARWVLRERDDNPCGPLYEVRDQYVYDVTR